MRLVVESDWQLWHTDCVESSNPTCLHLGKATGGVINSRTLCNQWGDRNLSGGLKRKSCLSSYCLHWTFSAPNPIITLTMQRDCQVKDISVSSHFALTRVSCSWKVIFRSTEFLVSYNSSIHCMTPYIDGLATACPNVLYLSCNLQDPSGNPKIPHPWIFIHYPAVFSSIHLSPTRYQTTTFKFR